MIVSSLLLELAGLLLERAVGWLLLGGGDIHYFLLLILLACLITAMAVLPIVVAVASLLVGGMRLPEVWSS